MMLLLRVVQAMPRVASWVRVVLVVPVVCLPLVTVWWMAPCGCFGGEGVVVDGSRRVSTSPLAGVGGFLVHRLWWLWFPLVAEVASGDADGGVMLAMVCLMLLAWVMYVLYPVLVCVGFVGDGAGGDGVGEGVVLA